MKKQVALYIKEYARKEGLTQKDIAELTDTTQPRVSDLFNLKIEKFSLDMLFKMLQNLSIETTLTFE